MNPSSSELKKPRLNKKNLKREKYLHHIVRFQNAKNKEMILKIFQGKQSPRGM